MVLFFPSFLVPWHNLFQENKVCTLFTCCSAEDVTSMIALCMVSRADLHCCVIVSIIGQDSPEVNWIILVHSYLVQILPYGLFLPKRHHWQPCIFDQKSHKFKIKKFGPCAFNKLLTNFACSSHTGEYLPQVVFVQILLCLVHTATTLGQYPQYGPCTQSIRRYYFQGR